MTRTFVHKNIHSIQLLIAVILFSLMPGNLAAQIDRTSLTGTVEDATGRAVAGASDFCHPSEHRPKPLHNVGFAGRIYDRGFAARVLSYYHSQGRLSGIDL